MNVEYCILLKVDVIPLCNYALPPVTVKVRKHSWKPFCESLFSSSVALLSVSYQKRRPFNASFSREET